MPRYAQLVIGPAGSGKSTYCSNMLRHCENIHRAAHVVNLDPAAEYFDYEPVADIKELIEVDDVMADEELRFGPNGGLVFCMEYFGQNFDWLKEQLGDVEDDYLIFDCPGQIELYTHIPVMKQLVETLQSWDFRICALFLVDSQFIVDTSKFFSGIMTALSTMVNLEVPHINVMSKMDLLGKKAKTDIEKFLDPDPQLLLAESQHLSPKFQKLNAALANLIEDYSLVRFIPLDPTDEESMSNLLISVDTALQYDEDQDVRIPRDADEDDGDVELGGAGFGAGDD
ncbi:GPN-loop GTPase 3-like [Patiria miniata]|uniref:GPN-loop GTPase 3 n=1 Tax=Patiria miniata TaxID=46514 RepID=A0A914A645_PATMI|nr:GPN-loop GTPase 3-like [Patiria miniata]XP_038059215.1 GPN-loop GTPase 3-like [Patiria miniata]